MKPRRELSSKWVFRLFLLLLIGWYVASHFISQWVGGDHFGIIYVIGVFLGGAAIGSFCPPNNDIPTIYDDHDIA